MAHTTETTKDRAARIHLNRLHNQGGDKYAAILKMPHAGGKQFATTESTATGCEFTSFGNTLEDIEGLIADLTEAVSDIRKAGKPRCTAGISLKESCTGADGDKCISTHECKYKGGDNQ